MKISVKEEVSNQFSKIMSECTHIQTSELSKVRQSVDSLKNFK